MPAHPRSPPPQKKIEMLFPSTKYAQTTTTPSIMPFRSTPTSNYVQRALMPTDRRQQLKRMLHDKIGQRGTRKTVMKTGKPVEIHLEHEAECPICLDIIKPKNSACTPCGHKFCFSCIAQNLARSAACPMCRAELTKKDPPARMPVEEIHVMASYNMQLFRSDLMHVMRGEEFSDSSSSSPSTAVSSPGVSEAGDVEMPDNVPTRTYADVVAGIDPVLTSIAARNAQQQLDASIRPIITAPLTQEYRSDEDSSDEDGSDDEGSDEGSDDGLEADYQNAVLNLDFHNAYTHTELTIRERNVFETISHMMLCAANDVSRWYNHNQLE